MDGEKIKEGLRHCKGPDGCKGCPYEPEDDIDAECTMLEEALMYIDCMERVIDRLFVGIEHLRDAMKEESK